MWNESIIKRIKEIIKYKIRKSRKNILRKKKKYLRVPISLLFHAILGIWYQIIITQGIHHIFYKITPRQHLRDKEGLSFGWSMEYVPLQSSFERDDDTDIYDLKGEGGREKIMVIASDGKSNHINKDWYWRAIRRKYTFFFPLNLHFDNAWYGNMDIYIWVFFCNNLKEWLCSRMSKVL